MGSFVRLFADDSSLQKSSSDLDEIERELNRDLQHLQNWSDQWLMELNTTKTEAVLFSTQNVQSKPDLVCNGNSIEFVNSHRHLGVLLSSNCKWTEHINNLCKSSQSKISALKQLKFKVSKTTLNTIYTSFIRPGVEYASSVWDGCSEQLSDTLEKIQLEAARIVSGLTSIASREALYFETGWVPLKERREKLKLSTFYKIHNQEAPDYLQALLPATRNNINRELRNPNNYQTPPCRLHLKKISFVPSSISLWNILDNDIKSSQSLRTFKSNISRIVPESPAHLHTGNRYLSVIHCRIRHKCSGLRSDLFRVGITQSPYCSCNDTVEDSFHFFFTCLYYADQREILFSSLRDLNIDVNLETLLWGNAFYSFDINCAIVRSVQSFVKSSKRFDAA